MSDGLRDQMVTAVADELGIDHDAASRALHRAWEVTAAFRGGEAPATYQPDMSDPGQALARRVQGALEHEFAGEDLFPCVIVVQENLSNRIGIAATALPLEDVEILLRLGIGAVRRTHRQFGSHGA